VQALAPPDTTTNAHICSPLSPLPNCPVLRPATILHRAAPCSIERPIAFPSLPHLMPAPALCRVCRTLSVPSLSRSYFVRATQLHRSSLTPRGQNRVDIITTIHDYLNHLHLPRVCLSTRSTAPLHTFARHGKHTTCFSSCQISPLRPSVTCPGPLAAAAASTPTYASQSQLRLGPLATTKTVQRVPGSEPPLTRNVVTSTLRTSLTTVPARLDTCTERRPGQHSPYHPHALTFTRVQNHTARSAIKNPL
jgi:hypothetical protein